MNFLELANKRRSCRKYLPGPVSEEALKRCIEAVRLAPSACNSQAWHFIVVQNVPLKTELGNAAFSGVYSMNAFAKKAGALVVVIREASDYKAKLGGFFQGTQYNLIDLGIACEHFILQAEEEGLGTCWIGWFNQSAVKKTLGLSKNKKIDVIISVGHPEDPTPRDKNRKPLSEIAEFR